MKLTINYHKIEEVKAKIATLDNRIKKGLGFAVTDSGERANSLVDLLTFSEPYDEPRQHITGEFPCETVHHYTVTLVDMEFTGNFMPSEEYKLIAVLEPFKKDEDDHFMNLIHKVAQDVEVPTCYRKTCNVCEHCNTSRQRNKYFVIQNVATGEFTQVGSSCMKKMFPITAEQITSFLTTVAKVFDEESEDGFGFGGSGYWVKSVDTVTFLGLAYEQIKRDGYINRKNNWSDRLQCEVSTTAETLNTRFFHAKQDEGRFTAEDEKNAQEKGEEILEFAQAMQGDSDYVYTVKLLTSVGTISENNFAIAASIAQCFIKDEKKKLVKEMQGEQIDVPEGRHTVTGVVASSKWVEGYGYYSPDVQKIVLQCEGFRVYGSVPSALGEVEVGDEITFTAALQPKEKGFGFYKRPTKAEYVKKLNEAA